MLSRPKTTAKPTPGFDVTGLDFSDDKVVGAINLLYRLKPYLHLVGGWGTAFRTPNIVERLSIIGGDDVTAEMVPRVLRITAPTASPRRNRRPS